MGGKVIQGFFLNGRPRLPGPPARPAATRPIGPPVQASAGRAVAQARGAAETFPVDPGLLGPASGGGRPLPDAVRGKMEAALGADFSGVRVHVGPQPERIGAVAFTMGSDIYFAPGRYQPDTMQGQQLLGHELAHVVQQRQGRVRNPTGAGIAVVQDRVLEMEADRLGQRAASYRAVAQAKAGPGVAQRSPAGAAMLPPGAPGAPGAVPPVRGRPWRAPVVQRLAFRTGGRTIQMEDLTIKVPGFQAWTRDVDDIDVEEDIQLFRQKIRNDNPVLTHVQIWQNAGQGGEHQYVVVDLEDGTRIQMDLAARGHTIWVHAGDPSQHNLRVASERRKAKHGLKLHDLFRQFRTEADRRYHMDTNDCTAFARRMFLWVGEAVAPPQHSKQKNVVDEDDFM